eukprot:13653506-Alexandrium_andersonii.AAC.1
MRPSFHALPHPPAGPSHPVRRSGVRGQLHGRTPSQELTRLDPLGTVCPRISALAHLGHVGSGTSAGLPCLAIYRRTRSHVRAL